MLFVDVASLAEVQERDDLDSLTADRDARCVAAARMPLRAAIGRSIAIEYAEQSTLRILIALLYLVVVTRGSDYFLRLYLPFSAGPQGPPFGPQRHISKLSKGLIDY